MFLFDLRDLLEILRGSSRPGPLVVACVLGCGLAFVPEPGGAGLGLALLHIALLLMLNTNLGLALLIAAPVRLLALALMPVSFHIGRFLVDGPLHGPVAWASNAPLLALLGLERYATVGGLVLTLVVGLTLGLIVARSIAAFRRRMAKLEAESERFGKVAGKVESSWYLSVLLWLFAGGKDDERSYQELLEAGRESPVRKSGVVLVLVGVALVWLFPATLGGPLLRPLVHDGLEDWNGATVDLESLQLDPSAGRLVLLGLALADPEALDTDVFRASRVEADVAIDDLLRKRLVIDRVMVVDGQQGAARAVPGERTRAPPRSRGGGGGGDVDEDDVSLEEVLEGYAEWEQRLSRWREWLDELSSDESEEDEGDWEDDLERQVEQEGWAGVVARGLVAEVPSLLISELVADGVRTTSLGDELVDVRASHISTHPELVDAPPRLHVSSRSGTLLLDLGLGGVGRRVDDNALVFKLRGISADALAGSWRMDGKPLVKGGTIDLDLDGTWADGKLGQLDLPFSLNLHDVTLDLLGRPQLVEQLLLPFSLRGSLDSPRIKLDRDDLDDALRAAAEAGLVGEARQRLSDELGIDPELSTDELKADLEEDLRGQAEERLGGLLGGLLGGDDEDDEDKDPNKPKSGKKKKNKKKQQAADAEGGDDGTSTDDTDTDTDDTDGEPPA